MTWWHAKVHYIVVSLDIPISKLFLAYPHVKCQACCIIICPSCQDCRSGHLWWRSLALYTVKCALASNTVSETCGFALWIQWSSHRLAQSDHDSMCCWFRPVSCDYILCKLCWLDTSSPSCVLLFYGPYRSQYDIPETQSSHIGESCFKSVNNITSMFRRSDTSGNLKLTSTC